MHKCLNVKCTSSHAPSALHSLRITSETIRTCRMPECSRHCCLTITTTAHWRRYSRCLADTRDVSRRRRSRRRWLRAANCAHGSFNGTWSLCLCRQLSQPGSMRLQIFELNGCRVITNAHNCLVPGWPLCAHAQSKQVQMSHYRCADSTLFTDVLSLRVHALELIRPSDGGTGRGTMNHHCSAERSPGCRKIEPSR